MASLVESFVAPHVSPTRRLFLRRVGQTIIATFAGGLFSGCKTCRSGGGGGITPSPVLQVRSASIANRRNVPPPQQLCQQWCWAACAENVVRSFGGDYLAINSAPVNQITFAGQVYGSAYPGGLPFCLPSTNLETIAAVMTNSFGGALTPDVFRLQGRYIYGVPDAAVISRLIRSLREDNPFIFGSRQPGHVLIAYAMDWWEDDEGNLRGVKRLYLADPFPASAYLAQVGYIPDYTQFGYEGPAGAQNTAGYVWAERA